MIRKWRHLLAGCATAAAAAASAETITLTMDELPFRAVHGLSLRGVNFDFRISGVASTDAHYGSGGPGSAYYVEDPSIEGNGAGILTLTFDTPTPLVEFGFAKLSSLFQDPAIAVELFDAGLNSLGVFPRTGQPLTTFTEGFFSYSESLVSKAVIDFDVNPETFSPRFAVDNLRFSTDDVVTPGSSPSVPLPPSGNSGEGFGFDIIVEPNRPVFIDPPVAVGYDYAVAPGGPNIASVVVPFVLPNGDGEFDLEVGGNTYPLFSGTPFDLLALDPLGFSSFRISGIDTSEMLSPTDPYAFVTGLTFVAAGQVSLTQTPIIVNVGVVPEASAFVPVGLGVASLFGFQLWRRRNLV